MTNLETVFDINRILVTLFNASEEIRKEKNIDLIFETDEHIPKELRGDSAVLLKLLTQFLVFILKSSDRDEILLTLTAPDDFLYEEEISFNVKDAGIEKEKILDFLETHLSKDIECLGGKIVDKDESFSDVSLRIPFKINELGFRRHYRLPVDNMLDKKVLIICESDTVAHSIEKLFEYFHYDIDVGLDAFKEHGSNLANYDIFLTEEKLCTGDIGPIISEAEELDHLRLVILKDKEKITNSSLKRISSYLSKPVTQKSIYDLIIKLFDPAFERIQLAKQKEEERNQKAEIEPMPVEHDEFQDTIEERKLKNAVVLDMEQGQNNVKKAGLVYRQELQHFLERFDHSDIYFREIVNEKSIHKIKEFCVDLEKNARLIGAESMLNFVDIVSLIFIYNKLEMLPIYPGRYHLELQKLLTEIRKQI